MSRRPAFALLPAAKKRADDHDWTVIALGTVQYTEQVTHRLDILLWLRWRCTLPARDCFRTCVRRLKAWPIMLQSREGLKHRLWTPVVYYTLMLLDLVYSLRGDFIRTPYAYARIVNSVSAFTYKVNSSL